MRMLIKKPTWTSTMGMTIIFLALISIILPNTSTYKINVVLGWLFLLTGIIYGMYTLKKSRGTLSKLVPALFYLSMGISLILFQSISTALFTFFITMLLLATSIFKMLIASEIYPSKGTGWAINAGIIDIILAVCIAMGYPSSSGGTFGFIIGMSLILFGVIIWKAQPSCDKAPTGK